MNKQPIGIDLFSGAGGLSLGFEGAGFRVIYALEKDKYATETYTQNRSGRTTVDVVDIQSVKPRDILSRLGLQAGDLDIVLGGPPCQGFSIANMHTRSMENPLNHLVFTYWEFVKELMPKWFLMENVAGLDKFANGVIKQKLLQFFEDGGYNVDSVVLNASCFGVPQLRRRIFFVGNRTNKSLDFLHDLAEEKTLNNVTVREAIDDLPILPNGHLINPMPYVKNQEMATEYQKAMRAESNGDVFNNLVSRNNALVLERYKHIGQGENWRALVAKKPELLGNYKDVAKCHEWIYLRLCWDKPSVVISNYRKNMLIHPTQDRGLSVREAARLQSFPDDYLFYGPLGYQQQQVVNAVPPLMGKAIAMAIKSID